MNNQALLDFIAEVEAGKAGYLAMQGTEGVDTSGMTLAEARALGQEYKARKDSSGAMGRYQIIPDTLSAISQDLDPNTPWDEDLQDMLAQRLLEKRGLQDYQAGKIDARELGNRLSKEWAALPKDESNLSYYHGKQGNRAGATFDRMLGVLNGPDVRVAGGDTSAMVPGDPVTGRADPPPPAADIHDPPRGFTPQIDPQGLVAPPRGSQRHQQMATYPEDLEDMPEGRPRKDMARLLIALGTGIGSASGRGGTGPGVMRGIRQGFNDYDRTRAAEVQADQELYELKTKRAEWQQKQAKQRQIEAAIQSLPEHQRAMAWLDPSGLSSMMQGPRYGTGAPIQVQRDGKTFLVHTDDQGNIKETPLAGTPIQYDQEARGGVAQAIAGGTARGKVEEGKRDSMESLSNLYGDVMTTIPKSTGSGAGAAWNSLMGFFGVATEGGINAAKLGVLGARMVQTVPRMEGPQSDKDVQMYKDAAGNIADPTVPGPLKEAAMTQIMDIARRQQALGNPIFSNIRLPGSAAAPAAPAALPTVVNIREKVR